MKTRNHLNVAFVTTVDLEGVPVLLFMKKRSYSNVTFVTNAFLEKGLWKYMLHQFMRKRNHFNVKFVTTAVLIRVP
jgi:hypothetical protein